MKKDWKLYLIIGIGLLAVLFLLFLNRQQRSFYGELLTSKPQINFTQEEKTSTTTLMFVGDIMLDRGVEQVVREEGKSFKFPFLEIKDYLLEADILFGNLESVISDQGYQIKQVYPFRAEPESIKGLKEAGFDIVSCANNHALDYGSEALKDSIVRLSRNNIECVGAGLKEKAYSPVVLEKENLEIAYLSYTYLAPSNWKASEEKVGTAWLNEENLKQGINKVKEESDLIVVSFHFGEEYEKKPNSFQKRYSRLAIDTGADLVIGHHPHVVQPVERYKNGWIAYSLGNFVFDQGFSAETMNSMLLKVNVKDNQIKKVTPLGVTINEYYQPVLD